MAVVIPFHRPPANWPPTECCRPDAGAIKRAPLKPSRVLDRIASAFSTYRRRRAAIRTLRSLDDRLLRDIGIERGDIVATVDMLLASDVAMRGCVIATHSKMPAEQ
ncbi:DUF1127 domain-containing protein [Rhodospirillaceae bacterium SYSU D60014]|uniref:DUF1127 domain-containing protein n=1 Tax=Virgifigura deserti TaxID=2268457 RepID=UPI000E675DCC